MLSIHATLQTQCKLYFYVYSIQFKSQFYRNIIEHCKTGLFNIKHRVESAIRKPHQRGSSLKQTEHALFTCLNQSFLTLKRINLLFFELAYIILLFILHAKMPVATLLYFISLYTSSNSFEPS